MRQVEVYKKVSEDDLISDVLEENCFQFLDILPWGRMKHEITTCYPTGDQDYHFIFSQENYEVDITVHSAYQYSYHASKPHPHLDDIRIDIRGQCIPYRQLDRSLAHFLLDDPSYGHYMTVGQLKNKLKDVDDDALVVYQRIEDKYFDKHGWEPMMIEDRDYTHRTDYTPDDDFHTTPVWDGWEQKNRDNVLCFVITAHY